LREDLKRKILFITGVLSLLIASPVSSCCSCDGKEHEKEVENTAGDNLKEQTVCPVMKAPVDKNLYVDYQGVRVFFCCEGCVSGFKNDPARYLMALKKMGEKPLQLK